MKKLLIVIAMLASTVVFASRAEAHVLITDEDGNRGAILHIIPDDDPIAGEPSQLYFDMQSNGQSEVRLVVTDEEGKQTNVPTKADGALVTATYTFPVQGMYLLKYTVASDGKTHHYEHTQRVSRGETNSVLERPTFLWAQALLVLSIVGIVMLLIVAFNKRHEILAQSK